jgi:hypothetical protein
LLFALVGTWLFSLATQYTAALSLSLSKVVSDVELVLVVDLVLAPLYATLGHELIFLATAQAGWPLSVPTVILVSFCIRSLRKDVLTTQATA